MWVISRNTAGLRWKMKKPMASTISLNFSNKMLWIISILIRNKKEWRKDEFDGYTMTFFFFFFFHVCPSFCSLSVPNMLYHFKKGNSTLFNYSSLIQEV